MLSKIKGWLHKDCAAREEPQQREEQQIDSGLIVPVGTKIWLLAKEIRDLQAKYTRCSCSLEGESDAE